MRFEMSSAIIGGLLVVLTLLTCYMALLLYKTKPAEGFYGNNYYRPACGNRWGARLPGCARRTGGPMPLIDMPRQFGCPACSNPV